MVKQKLDEEEIENFLKAIEQTFNDFTVKPVWPLNVAQITSYFDAGEAVDMYHRVNNLNKKMSIKEIAKIMPSPDILRLFMQGDGFVGLKVAKQIGLKDVRTEDRIKYANSLFSILKDKVKNDIFCLDGKNLLLSGKEVYGLLKTTKWDKPTDDRERKDIAYLIAMANNFCYSLFFDAFKAGGFYIHGPYDISDELGKDTILIIREYHDLNPTDLWPDLKMPYKKMQLMTIYHNLDFRLDFLNHPTSQKSIPDKLVAYKILLDGKEISIKEINEFVNLIHRLSVSQTKKINLLSDPDKVRKGAEIAFYLFKDLREYMGDDWRPPKFVNETIEEFGDEFIVLFKKNVVASLEEWKKLLDPRNDYLLMQD